MAPILRFIISSGYKNKESRCAYLNEAKASHAHDTRCGLRFPPQYHTSYKCCCYSFPLHIDVWNENQLMSLFYSYIAGSLHVSGPQAHLQESSYSCSHNHWFSACAAVWVENSHQDRPQHTEHANRTAQTLNHWFCEQLYELSWRRACGPETYRDPAIYE